MAMRTAYHRAVVKLIFLCARRAGLDRARYAAHLLERHAPLALRHHASLRRYVLNLVDEGGDAAESIDSVNALHYDAFADFELRNYDSAEGERIVTEDHARFLGSASGYLTEESVQLEGGTGVAPGARTPGTKWICALRRSARLSRDRFFAALESDLVPELLAAQALASRVAVDRVERKLYPGGPEIDAFLETSFPDAARAPLHPFDSFDCGMTLRGRLARLTDATTAWRVSEYVQRV